MTLRWRTSSATGSRVRFGTALASLDGSISSATATTEHSVTLTGLVPNTLYYYAVGNLAGDLAGGADYFFYTAPTAGTRQPMRFWVLGDAGTGSAGQMAVRNAFFNFAGTRYTDLLLLLGDNAYNNGTEAEYQARHFDIYQNLLRSTVSFSTVGNHDTAQQSNPDIATTPYFLMFDHPAAGEAGGVPSGTEKYYAFDYGNVHFVCLDSMTSDRSVNGAMLTWLEADLAQNTADWLVAFFHHPPYSKGSHDSDTEGLLIDMRANALPVLEANGVDLVLSGHSHSYERSYLLDGHYGSSGTLTPAMKLDGGSGREDGSGAYLKPGAGPVSRQGAVYVVPGSAGQISGGSLNHPAMFVSLNQLGSFVLDVDGQRLDARFVTDTGAINDHFTLLKSGPANLPPTVAIVSPTDGAISAEGAGITVVAAAADPDGAVVGVSFYDGANLLGTVSAEPFSLVWNGATPGLHALTAVATDDAGAQTTSAVVTLQVVGLPDAPTALAAQPLSESAIRLTWQDNAANETDYVVARSADGQTYAPVATLAPDSGSYTDEGLPAGQTFHYTVVARNVAGESAAAGPESATTLPPPAVVFALADADLPVSGTVAQTFAQTHGDDGVAQTLTEVESGGKPSSRYSLAEHRWRFANVRGGLAVTVQANAWAGASTDGDSFIFEYSTDGGGAWSPLFVIAAGTGPANTAAAVLPAGTRGEVLIRTRDSNRSAGGRELNTVWVDQLVIRTDLDPNDTPPAPPTDVAAVAVSAGSVRVTWADAADNESGFEIERSVNGGAFAPIATVAADAETFLDTGAAPVTSYRYRVRSFTASYLSDWAESGPVTTPDGMVLAASGFKRKGSAVADLTWSGGASVGQVRIWRSVNGGAPQLIATVGNASGGTYQDNTGLKSVTLLTYQVCSVDGTVCSNEASVAY